jgi:hypothetical protein
MGDHVITSVRGLGKGDRQLCTGTQPYLYFTQGRSLLKISSTKKEKPRREDRGKCRLEQETDGRQDVGIETGIYRERGFAYV